MQQAGGGPRDVLRYFARMALFLFIAAAVLAAMALISELTAGLHDEWSLLFATDFACNPGYTRHNGQVNSGAVAVRGMLGGEASGRGAGVVETCPQLRHRNRVSIHVPRGIAVADRQ